MARIDLPEETRKRIEAIGTPELVVGIAGPVHLDDFRDKIGGCLSALPSGQKKTVVVYAGTQEATATDSAGILDYVPYPSPQVDPSFGPWAEISAAQRSALAMASLFQTKACVVLHPDLHALTATSLGSLVSPALDGKADLVCPLYPEDKYDGLINKSILQPLSRALFGRRVRTPLPFDFCASGRILPALNGAGPQRSQPGPLLWPSHLVSFESGQICQTAIEVMHTTHAEGLELSTVMAELVGALFGEVEAYAAQWQRVRGSQVTLTCEAAATTASEHPEDAKPLDTRPLIDSFVLGSRNLEEVWRLVLPPVTLFELKRLTRLTTEEFRMADELWARIIYDFALAWHVRRIGRSHLLGALTPLYLGWVASYAQDVAAATAAQADQRIQLVAQVFEVNKPYFVSRWRWPDRAT